MLANLVNFQGFMLNMRGETPCHSRIWHLQLGGMLFPHLQGYISVYTLLHFQVFHQVASGASRGTSLRDLLAGAED